MKVSGALGLGVKGYWRLGWGDSGFPWSSGTVLVLRSWLVMILVSNSDGFFLTDACNALIVTSSTCQGLD